MNEKPINNKFLPIALIISLIITLGIGFTASLFTRPEIAGWYAGLQKPWFNPPAWLFAPVWTTLYVLMGIAAWLVWRHREKSTKYYATGIGYAFQLLFNFSWSIIFFGMHQIFGALIVIILLWISILANIILFDKYSKIAAWLLVPYLLWVTFAGFLNLFIYLLNR
jgi:tryptophan-rich sensory protein